MKDLAVEVLKEHKKPLSKRFTMSNFVYSSGFYSNKNPCPLCEECHGCVGCPFDKFATKHSLGCIHWVRKIAGNKFACKVEFDTDGMRFEKKDKDFIKSALKKLKDGAQEYIKWV